MGTSIGQKPYHSGFEVLLIEDQLHERLDRWRECALWWGVVDALTGCSSLGLFLTFILLFAVRIVAFLDEYIFVRLGFSTAISPLQT